jgi:hypothetical protein
MRIEHDYMVESQRARQERQENANLAYTENLAAGRCSDTRLVLRALQQRWPIPDEIRKFLPEWMGQVVKNENLSFRERTTAAKILLEIEKINLEAEEQVRIKAQLRQEEHMHSHGEHVFAEIAKAAAVIKRKAQNGELDLGANPITDARPGNTP